MKRREDDGLGSGGVDEPNEDELRDLERRDEEERGRDKKKSGAAKRRSGSGDEANDAVGRRDVEALAYQSRAPRVIEDAVSDKPHGSPIRQVSGPALARGRCH